MNFQASIERSLESVMAQVPECLACGLADISKQRLLGVLNMENEPPEVLPSLAGAAASMFEGPLVHEIDAAFAKARGYARASGPAFHTVIIYSDNVLHLMLRLRDDEDLIATFVCRKSVNLSLLLLRANEAIASLSIRRLKVVK